MNRSTPRFRRLVSALVPRSLQAQMIVLVGALVLVQLAMSAIIFGSLVADVAEDNIGKRALDIAGTVALDPVVKRGLTAGDPGGDVQSLAESIREVTGAEFVVVCDTSGVRLSHPDAWKIGKHFVGGDTGPVVREGRRYTSKAVGTLGPSLRGFAPVLGDHDEIIGFVSVGYLLEDVERTIHTHQFQPWAFVVLMALVGLLAAVVIAGWFKRAILGLEPREIASLYQERSTILETLREGVIAVDEVGIIRLANPAAYRALDLDPESDLTGQKIGDVFPRAGVDEVLIGGKAVLDREVVRFARELVVDMIPVLIEGKAVGVVASFRRKDELDQLTRELARTRETAEMQRVQAHEFSNKLHTIAGLIQIEAYQEALDLILRESTDYQDLIAFLNQAIPHRNLSGLILGKMNRASELKVNLTIDRNSSLRDIPDWLDTERLVTILGNLVDNALEAAVRCRELPRRARLSMTDLGRDLVIEVEDNGPGVPPERIESIFSRGVSTKKGGGHGVGLYLVAENLRELGGTVSLSRSDLARSDLGGALFTVIIPKTRTAGP